MRLEIRSLKNHNHRYAVKS